uniref:Glycosyltransferase group 1 family protein n=1 Tax=Paenibacillus mucilaginosus K02 TaxID=997761 RepID=V9IRH6_9BACL|nr:glycosyltransferase group 1 family protein [Paenibacillus mucilaginosus K02]
MKRKRKGKKKSLRPLTRKHKLKRRRPQKSRKRRPAAASSSRTAQPAAGVNLVGYTRAEMGLGEGARFLARAMDTVGIPFGVNNFELGNSARMEDWSWAHREQADNPYRVNLIHINGDQMRLVREHYGEEFFRNRYNIGYWAWELTELPEEWNDGFTWLHEIWTPSPFVRDTIAKSTALPVHYVPYGLQFDSTCDRTEVRSRLALPWHSFLFLVMYDVNSTALRKNPQGAIEAFKQAFAPADPNVGLVVKINNAQSNSAEVDQLRAALAEYPNIFLIEQTLSRSDVYALIDSCDVFVSLHRSEGFGSVMAESMYLGKPVIGTLWSGNTSFMNPENCCAVGYTLQEIGEGAGPYKAHQIWAEPDLVQAAGYMQRLAADEPWRRQVASAGQQTIRSLLTPEASGQAIRQRLTELGLL